MASPITISAPRQGIAQSPHIGFAECVNLNIDEIPGIAKLNNIMSKKSSTTVTGQPNWIVRHPVTTTEIYVLDNAGVVYKSADSGATWAVLAGETAGGHGNGMWIWKNYLFVARDAFLDVCGDGSATGIIAANWTNGWKAIDSDVLWHPMLTSKLDGKLYGGAGKYIFHLKEETGQTFAPGTPATYTWTQQALSTIPAGYRVKCLAELGNNLMIGTWQGTAITDIRVADIFTWDGTSTTYGQPIEIDDFGVHAMKNIGGSLVVLAGVNGTIRRCDGANSYVIGQLPIDLTGGKYLEFYPGALCNYKNKTFFGVGNGGTTAIAGMGVYSLLQTGKGNILNLEHQNSLLTTGSAASVKMSALLPVSRDTLLTGWRSDTTYGLDLTTNTSYAYGTDYSGYFVSPLYTVGSNKSKRKFTEIEFSLARPLRTSEGIKLEYRLDLTASWTTIRTFSYADVDVGAVVSKNIITEIPNDIKVGEQVQFKISLNGSATTSPELKSVTIR
jgi:hypothetical protein